MRKFLPLFVIFVLLLTAQAGNVTVYFFYSTTCSHCHEESIFLTNLESRYPSVEIKRFAVDVSPSNAELLEKFMKAHDVPPLSGVPQTYIGDDVVLGYTNYETTGKLIEAKINTCLELGCNQTNISIAENYVINYPLLGRIDLKTLSLPALSVLIGLLDGFNPCAMWVLIYLIMMLSSTRDRKKMILVIGTFVLASGVWYFLIMSAWLNIFLFIGMANITRFIIGLIAVGAGLMNLKDFITLPKAVCKVTDAASQSDIMKKIDRFAKTGVVPATLLGIIILAFTVNTIEFACSFTFPALFTSILASNKLPALEYYFYILVYIFFYMLDDMIIFSVAVITLSSSDFSLKYGKFSQLVGGVTLLLLGLLLLFMPQVLSAI